MIIWNEIQVIFWLICDDAAFSQNIIKGFTMFFLNM